MTNIILTGIPGVGKGNLVKDNLAVLRELRTTEPPSKVFYFSAGERFIETASGEFRIPKAQAARMEENIAIAIRSSLLSEALNQAGMHEHVILSTPLTISKADGRFVPTFKPRDFMRFAEGLASRTIDWVVCLLDSALKIEERLRHAGLDEVHLQRPKNGGPDDVREAAKTRLLDWVSTEVAFSQWLADLLKCRLLITSTDHAETSLVKLLLAKDPHVLYYGQPITNVKGDRDAENKILFFGNLLQEYAVVIYPIVLADQERGQLDYSYTFHRDLYWFLSQSADSMVAYFPTDKELQPTRMLEFVLEKDGGAWVCEMANSLKLPEADIRKILKSRETFTSLGVLREMSEARAIGKPLILVHPNAKADHPFLSYPPERYCFKTENEFRDGLHGLPNPFSKMFRGGKRPKFEGMMNRDRFRPYRGVRAKRPVG